MSEYKLYTIGEIIKALREDQNISIQQLSHNVCSVATLSRIESGKRDIDMMTATILFGRLGYHADKFDIYLDKQEFDLYQLRTSILQKKEQQKFDEMAAELDTYQIQLGNNTTPLHQQFIKYMQGFLKIQSQEFQDAIHFLEESLSVTVPDWNTVSNSKLLLSFQELELLNCLSDAYEKIENEQKAYSIRYAIIHYLEKHNIEKKQMVSLYTKLVCQLAPYFLKQGFVKKSLALCEQGLDILGDTCTLYHLPQIMYWKAKSEEVLLASGERTVKTVIGSYQRAYYFYRMLNQTEEAENLKIYLEENYQWQSIR